MAETFSQLIYRQVEPMETPATTVSTLIALHGHQGWVDDLVPLATSIHPGFRVVAAEAARGVYFGTKIISKTWFGGTLVKPEAASFGDSLAQIERFIHDVQHRHSGSKPWLLGFDQGAVLALSIAYIAPDLISGVMAINGGLPHFTTPGLLEPMEGRLPILLVSDGADQEETPLIGETSDQLRNLGHQVTVRQIESASALEPEVAHDLRQWLDHSQMA